MTTINANVFSELTNASSILIARATELLNDSRLTSLEFFKQELNDGVWKVRVSTAADNMRGNPAVFVDAIRDSQNNVTQPGQIVLRSENLSSGSDMSVLRLIENIVHEGLGHGSRIHEAGREDARRDLVDVNAEKSATTRGDNYINAILDDETAARYESYQFRTQLASLNTEYTASNRASLATDPLYQRFAQLECVADGLGLTDGAKATYIVENSREQMAAYNNHSYPMEAGQYVIDVLHLNGMQRGVTYLN